MARPLKEGLDYFSHDVDSSNDDKIDSLEAVYGNDGYACYFKLLERIYRNGGKIFISDAETLQKYARRCNILEIEKFEKIINLMAKIGLFNEKLWMKAKCLTSNGILKRVQVVIDKRDRMKSYSKSKVSAPVISAKTIAETPQSKVKQSKVKQSKALPPEKPLILEDEIKSLKILGYDYLKIKDHLKMREVPEAEIDLALGKNF